MSILSTAYSGLNAFQRALEVTGNNIANATTRGYSRQSINFTPGASQKYAGSYIGRGVNVASVMRNVDQFASFQVRTTQSARSEYDAFYQQASQIDKLLSQDGISISSSLQSFFDSLGQLNSAPDSITARNIALKQSQLLTNQFNFLQNKIDEYQNNSTTQIIESTNQINQITREIAKVNGQVMANGDDPGLLDHRDDLLNQLAAFVDINVFNQSDHTISVGLASGEMLVTGPDQRDLVVSADLSNNFGTSILLDSGTGQIDVSSKITSGMLGGLMSYEKNILSQSSQMIGQMAIGLAQKFNAQHQLGMNMYDQTGQNFFTDFNNVSAQNSRSIRSSSNTGSASLSVTLSDISQIKLSDYEVLITDASNNQYQLIRKSDGAITTGTWEDTSPPSAGGQFVIDGMTVSVDDVTHFDTNDRFTLTPTRGAARDLGLEITDIKQIALASPVKTTSALANTGSGQVSLGTVFNTDNVTNRYTLIIDAQDPTQYRVVTSPSPQPPLSDTSGPYSLPADGVITLPPAPIPTDPSYVPSYSISLTGKPNAGDQFTMEYNAGGVGDNRNGLDLAGLQESKLFTGGTESLFDRYAHLLGEIGSQTSQAKFRADSADVLYKQAVDFQDSKSGVNLDEEAANLLKYKQAYEAAGKLMEISSQIMSIIIDMVR